MHASDDIHFTAEVFIVHKGRVLLRMHEKYHFWCSIGGHIEPREDPNQAALREVKEEVGLDIALWDGNREYTVREGSLSNLIPPVALNRHVAGDAHEHVTFVYFATTQSDAVTPEHPGDEWRWASKEDILSMDLKDNIREYALGALKTLGEAS